MSIIKHNQDPQQSIKSSSVWNIIQRELLEQYGEKLFSSWFSKIHFLKSSDSTIYLGVKTKFLKDWILDNYLDLISNLWQQYDNTIKSIKLSVETDLNPDRCSINNIAQADKIKQQAITSNSLDKRFIFNNFVVGSSNELAYSASRSIAEAKTAIPGSNPLFLYGGVGLGKTHLMQSIAWYILANNVERKFIYISAEKFMYQFVQALRNKNLLEFKEQFRSVDVLMIDDIQFISGKDSTQEEFFHTFNTIIDSNKQMIISCDRSPTDLDNVEERIKSRLGWGLVADLHSTTYELRIGILQSKIEQMQVKIPKDVIEFIADKVKSNVRELEGALNKVVAHINLIKHPIDLETVRYLLKDLVKANEKIVTIEEIKKKICRHYGIKMSDMTSSARTRNISRPRQLAMYFSKLLTPKSLAEIGEYFGHKDHTTVMHAIKKIEHLCKTNIEFYHEVNMLKNIVKKYN